MLMIKKITKNNMEINDKEIREELSKILGCYELENFWYGYSQRKMELKILSWIEIANKIGKLQKEANGK